MKKKMKYRLMSTILTGALFISGYKPNIVLAKSTALPIIPNEIISTEIEQTIKQQSVDYKTNSSDIIEESKESLEEFLSTIKEGQEKKFYRELFKLYDYNTFYERTEIPYYFQSIYGDKFSVGTIQSAGCGISSLAMVSSYLFDEVITPDMMVKYDGGPSPATAFEKAIKSLKLNCEKIYGKEAANKLDEALDNGHPIVALMGPSSYFTNTGHFIVIAGKTPDGKYIVNDPNIENLYKASMIDGFTNGFSKEIVTQGLRGIYIFDTKEQFVDNRHREISIPEWMKKSHTYDEEFRKTGSTKKETALTTSPTKSSDIVKNLEINSVITRLLTLDNGYSLVRYKNSIGYILDKTVSYENDSISYLTHTNYQDILVTLSKINLKQSPIESSHTILSINESSELESIAITDNNWLIVKYNNQIGYVKNENLISLLEQTQKLYPELNITELKPTKLVYITTPINLRVGNDIEFDAISLLNRYESVRVLKEYKNWYLVLTNERTIGFIQKKYTKELEGRHLIGDKSTKELRYYNNQELLYTTKYFSIAKGLLPKDGMYPILTKSSNYIILSPESNWKNEISSNPEENTTLRKIYKQIEVGDNVIIHK